jgi:hypothetical protein
MGFQKGPMAVTTKTPQDKLWDTLISNVPTQPKHHTYVVSSTLTGPAYCETSQSHQINWPLTPSTVA